ncbi:MAG: mechanosensitive ion channel [Lutibacter sp.]|uniref:mechanosensitive ion channel family protein n=1 Tax=Lutibacter sp. TaxID=1925666 RepID=UPI00185C9313|nr:mechanosensitive ion channel domain-containing protein [Lutibacter sp.]MBT8316599.1 mechanosensitive ion channel [Lutibacter sp.]NNJ57459.1 mechanosensitive ion channel [Lutibacter sp.]
MDKIVEFLNYEFTIGKDITISIKAILLICIVLFATSLLMKWARKFITRKLPDDDKVKFVSLFSYGKWFIYVIIILMLFHNIGVNVTAIFAASTALLVGVGLALQTLFQDIISGIFILLDQSVHVGDIIELDGKIGRVENIKLRTTRAVTIDNKVLIIPNHLYLTNSLYNWTENGTETRENVTVGVAYGSDVQLVKKLLVQAANSHPSVLKEPVPLVLFTNFGDSSLDFKLIFTLNNSFEAGVPKSDIRFEIDKLFRENNIVIPFPQRDVHMYKTK